MSKIRMIIEVPSSGTGNAITEIQNEWLSVIKSPFKVEEEVPSTGDNCYRLLLVPEKDWRISFIAQTSFHSDKKTIEIRVPVESLKISGDTFNDIGITNAQFHMAVDQFVLALMQSNQRWQDTGSCFSHLQQQNPIK